MVDNPIIICGPTASGKSFFTKLLAKKLNAVIVNADSCQIYESLPILTASPTAEDKIDSPHYLYNFVKIEKKYSVAQYLEDFRLLYDEMKSKSRIVIVGGTGLYINALINGIAPIPEIDLKIRKEVEEKFSNMGNENFYQELMEIDPSSAGKLNPGDSQRIKRAFEVMVATGKSIFEFHKAKTKPIIKDAKVIMLNPERKFLYNICDERLEQMLKNGAIDEVKAILGKNDIENRAIGVREIINYLQGKCSLQDVISGVKQKTRNYAKRQITWFKHQIDNKLVVNYSSAAEAKQEFNDILSKLF